MQRRMVLVAFTVFFALAGCGTVRNTVVDGDDANLILRGNDAYRFASAANRDRFIKDPARYAPAYTGLCSAGAPYALKAAIGANVFFVYRDRLFLFGSERSKRGWLLDPDRNIELGDRYWTEETRDVPYRLQNAKRYVFKVPHYKTDAELDAEYDRRKAAGTLPPELR